MLKRTPLFSAHQKLGGKLIEFGGWEMPVQYSSIMDEHLSVRKAAGIFDISHMGEVLVYGPEAPRFLNRVLTNDLNKLFVGHAQYTLMCNQRGGVMDDLYVYRSGISSYLLVINASRIDRDIAWFQTQLEVFPDCTKVSLDNISDRTGAVAVQGPRVAEFIDQFIGDSLSSGIPITLRTRPGNTQSVADSWGGGTPVAKPSELKKNQFASLSFGTSIELARTGYTGEDGFEIIAPAEIIETVWNRILEIGGPFGLKPCGLGARDTLRTEVCYPLYGHELDESTTPIEAGLGFFVAFNKGDFVGRPVLAEQKEKGVSKKCVAFKMTDKSAPPRPHYPILSTDTRAQPIGQVTSGTQSPSLGIGIGMGYVPPEFAKPGTPIEIEIRGKRAPAVVVQKPIYKKPV